MPAPDDVVDSPARVAFNELSALLGNEEGIQVQAVALTRTGRSRRTGAQLDLELTVAVLATGEHALEGIERVLSLAEQRAWSCGQLPDRIADRHPQSLGLTVTVPVALPVAEPTGPIVTHPPVVQVDPTWRPTLDPTTAS